MRLRTFKEEEGKDGRRRDIAGEAVLDFLKLGNKKVSVSGDGCIDYYSLG
jgi:hypothetical protein